MHRRGEQIGAALQPLAQRRHAADVTTQEAAYVVAEAVVPLHPSAPGPGATELVAAGGVPRLGDHAHSPSVGPPVEPGDERLAVAEHGGQIEAEPVDAEIGETVQCPDDQLLRGRRRGVDGVAAPGGLDVRHVVAQAVVGRVSQPAVCVDRPGSAGLGGVVEHDV